MALFYTEGSGGCGSGTRKASKIGTCNGYRLQDIFTRTSMNEEKYSDAERPEREEEGLERYWIAQVRCGDRLAFRLIFERYYETLLSFALRYLRRMADAEGAVQDVFLWIWENREKWRVEGSLKTYLYSAVKHRCLDLIRKKALKEKYVSEEMANQQANPGHHDFPVDLDGEKFEHIVRNAIEMLPERARIIYKMSRSDGLTYNEIAKILEISPKTVESQMSRALDILRTRLSRYFMMLLTVLNFCKPIMI